jgi:hypothetical protein
MGVILLVTGFRSIAMSIAERDYMKSGFDEKAEKTKRPSLYKRIMFFLWRMVRSVVKKPG